MADEAGVAVFGGVFVHVDGVDVCSGVCFVDDCGDLGHAFGVVDVAEAMPQDDGAGGRGFGLFEEDFLLREGEGERKQTEEEREEHNNDCAVLTSTVHNFEPFWTEACPTRRKPRSMDQSEVHHKWSQIEYGLVV